MKNKGFTLIELLAVIVILAIIALIATPVILGIINDARESAKARSAELVVSTVQRDYLAAYTKNGGNVPTLTQLANAVKDDLSNVKEVTTDTEEGTLTVVTGDDVTCVFKVDGNRKLVLEGNQCGSISVGTASVEIGVLSVG